MVRDQYEPRDEVQRRLTGILEEIIVLRGWDLGAELPDSHLSLDTAPGYVR